MLFLWTPGVCWMPQAGLCSLQHKLSAERTPLCKKCWCYRGVQWAALPEKQLLSQYWLRARFFFKLWQLCWRFISKGCNVQKHPCRNGARWCQCDKGSELFLTLFNLTLVYIFYNLNSSYTEVFLLVIISWLCFSEHLVGFRRHLKEERAVVLKLIWGMCQALRMKRVLRLGTQTRFWLRSDWGQIG